MHGYLPLNGGVVRAGELQGYTERNAAFLQNNPGIDNDLHGMNTSHIAPTPQYRLSLRDG